jgi:hypothetical protein
MTNQKSYNGILKKHTHLIHIKYNKKVRLLNSNFIKIRQNQLLSNEHGVVALQ